MTPISRRSALTFGSLALLSACGSLTKATEQLDVYTLSPLQGSGSSPSSIRHLVVELPTSSGELATDRIRIKPNPLQAEYLPKVRWADATPVLLQSLLVASLQNNGAFRLVGRDGAGLTPDYVLLVEVNDFQAEAPAAGQTPTPDHVGLTMTMVREGDGSLIATRRFDQTALATSGDTLAVVAAFDDATRKVLSDAATWILKLAR